MKDKQIKLFGAYGDYVPGFFKISIDKKLFERITWNDFNSEEKATLIHEYVHFLQDISTTRGINNFLHVSKMLQLNFTKAYEQAEEFILLPFDFEKIGAEDAYVESELQSFYMGESKHIKVHHIDRICREEEELINGIINNEKLFAINIFYDNKDYPYVLGNTVIAESMAYLIETYKFGGLRRQNEFPYNICEMICKKECSLLYENKALLVAACELSLMHYHSGDMFWHILAEINQHDLAFNQVSNKNYDSNVCTICPWQQAEKDELCLFGMYWRMYSLTGKKVKRK